MRDMSIKSYKVVVQRLPEDLTRLVQDMIEDGWQPYGSPQLMMIAKDKGTIERYCQAMVKYEA